MDGKFQPNASYTWHLLCAILTRPGDGHFSNYLIDLKGDLYCVDNDCSFVELVKKSSSTHFCAAPFAMLPLDTPLDLEVLKQFVALDAFAILIDWIENVIDKEKEFLDLFSNEKERDRLFTEDPDNAFVPTILFKEGALSLCIFSFGLCRTLSNRCSLNNAR